jgi:Tfp pilus assembly protein PilO
MKRFRTTAMRGVDKLGWPGVLGLGLIAFMVSFYFSTFLPEQIRRDDLRGQVERALNRRRAPAPGQRLKNIDDMLNAFYRAFPPSDHVADALGRIYAAAYAQSLSLEKGEYRAVKDKVGRITHYQIVLPVKGNYTKIRMFVSVSLAQLPNLALESIQFDRDKIGDANVEAKIKFVMFLGQGA